MRVFSNILVGLDLAGREPFPAPVRQAIDTGLWLAGELGAQLTFVSLQGNNGSPAGEVAARALATLVRSAQEKGIRASARPGQHATAADLIRSVEEDHYDLLVVGKEMTTGLWSWLFGSMESRLLEQCPCPVWLSTPAGQSRPRTLLLASDLGPGSDQTLRLGFRLAQCLGIRTHLLHVVDYPLEHHWSTGEPDPLTLSYHRSLHDAAEKKLAEQLERDWPAGACEGPEWLRREFLDVKLHVVGRTNIPDIEILHFLQHHAIDLLVLGTAGHKGLQTWLLGNTAERLLPELPCAVLHVKVDNR